jgi:hypothetical protein
MIAVMPLVAVTVSCPTIIAVGVRDKLRCNSTKKLKNANKTTEIVVKVKFASNKIYALRALLDSGMTTTMMLSHKLVERPCRISTYKGPPVRWSALGDIYTTKGKARINFGISQFSQNKTSISWVCHVDLTTDPAQAHYNMIIGVTSCKNWASIFSILYYLLWLGKKMKFL